MGAPPPHTPLHGMTVVGLEHSVAGPLCTRILSDLGADVIKIERPGRGDFSRHWDDHARGEGAQFWWLNRGKRSAALDLNIPEDRQTFDALLESADALVVNFTPAATERLGLSSVQLRDRYPRLVACRISGYGATTSQRDRKAYDMLVQAEAGYMSLTGVADQPVRVGVSVCDVSTGIYAALLVVAALTNRMTSGVGADLDVSMLDVAAEFAGPMLLSYMNSGVSYPRIGMRHHAICPYGAYTCADGGTIVFAVQQDAEWTKFCAHVLGSPELGADQRFATNLARVENRDAVDALVSQALMGLSRAEAIDALEQAGIAHGSLNTMREVAGHPALWERDVFDTAEMADGTVVSGMRGIAARAFAVEQAARRPPLLGEDTDDVIKRFRMTPPPEEPSESTVIA